MINSPLVKPKPLYRQTYEWLRRSFLVSEARVSLPDSDWEMYQLPFHSPSARFFPAEKGYYAPKLGGSSLNLNSGWFEGPMEEIVQISDDQVEANQSFHYLLIKSQKIVRAPGAIILLHGLNEKDWAKYLPWAAKLVDITGKAVILFPVAFHVNRAFTAWHHPRLMDQLSQRRQVLFQNMAESSFTNAAISTRLHFAPTRFFFSGLQTYHDIIGLVGSIRLGQVPYLEESARIDFLGYSAGALLAQILLMANRNQLFDESRAVLFCGGPLLSRMHLTSRYIMDSEAHQAIRDFYVDNFDRNLEQDTHFSQRFYRAKKGGIYFKSMLSESYGLANHTRKQRLAELKGQLTAIALAKDTIMPFSEIQASLVGLDGQVLVPCRCFDFPYDYTHMNPFPNLEKFSTK
ncbi:MAG: hypothetical protein HC880_18740 [Bacteroidia bacterium]|nr:hypothetical protein [Bacteroidia bacterium]